MHKYHWADVCTALRLVCVGFIIAWAFQKGPVVGVLAAFALGELMDALDGSLARRYPYPNDGTYRWWRDSHHGRLPEIYDQIADLLLGAVTLLYIGLNLWLEFAVTAVVVAIVVALPIQIWRSHRIRLIPDEDDDPLRQKVILARRSLYLIAIVAIILVLIWNLPYPTEVKFAIIGAGIVVGLILWRAKHDRMERDKPKATTE